MTISQLAKAAHLKVDTIRYYEKFGLISDVERSQVGYRQYDRSHTRKLMFISKCKQMGYTLNEIKAVINSDLYEVIQKLYTDIHMNRDEIDNIKNAVSVKINALEQQRTKINDQIQLLGLFLDRLKGNINQEKSGCIFKNM
jgi:DNA-binding transcriptional MerR regulator